MNNKITTSTEFNHLKKKVWVAPQIFQLQIKETKSWSVFNNTETGGFPGFLGTPAS